LIVLEETSRLELNRRAFKSADSQRPKSKLHALENIEAPLNYHLVILTIGDKENCRSL
jgi:hypothetical protein